MSFGMIFSIILIIIFIASAIYGIIKFLEFKDTMVVGKFVERLEEDTEKIWKSTQGSQEFSYSIPSDIELVCFVDYDHESEGQYSDLYYTLKQAFFEKENMFFYPIGSGNGLDSTEIAHLDMNATTFEENPFCIRNDGEIKMILKKNYRDSLVRIEKVE